MYLAMRDVSAWSARMRAGYESVYGEDFPALWAAWIDGFIEYLVRILNYIFCLILTMFSIEFAIIFFARNFDKKISKFFLKEMLVEVKSGSKYTKGRTDAYRYFKNYLSKKIIFFPYFCPLYFSFFQFFPKICANLIFFFQNPIRPS